MRSMIQSGTAGAPAGTGAGAAKAVAVKIAARMVLVNCMLAVAGFWKEMEIVVVLAIVDESVECLLLAVIRLLDDGMLETRRMKLILYTIKVITSAAVAT